MSAVAEQPKGDALVADEVALLASLVPLANARILELGCGAAEFARRLLERTEVASVTGLEVDRIQHERNLQAPAHPRLAFGLAGAEDIPFGDASFDGVLMLKSLHHVPVALLDQALREVRRVLKPGGWLYVSEPVFAGDFNEIVRLFHDEQAVRQAACEALGRAAAIGILEPVLEKPFLAPRSFRDYDEFVAKVVRATHTNHAYPDDVAAEVRSRFERARTPTGVHFILPMRVNLMRRPRQAP